MYVKHSMINENVLESREYQEAILRTALSKNTLCVLPTGLGKTNISILLAAENFERHPKSKILVLAPTRPLVNQHMSTFLRFLRLDKDDMESVTGAVKPAVRQELYKEKSIIFATPQTIQNDLKEGRLSLKDFSLLIIDEIHHAVGAYAYPYIAQAYLKQSANPRILGLTASPGGTADKIKEICRNCGIEAVEIRSEKDKDVRPYVKTKEIEWVNVKLPETFIRIRGLIDSVYRRKASTLRKMGLLRGRSLSKKSLLSLQTDLIKEVKQGQKRAFIAISVVTQMIKLEHSMNLLETQSIGMLEKYISKLRDEKSKASKVLLNDKDFSRAAWITHSLYESDSKHPKMSKLASILHQEFLKNPNSKVIIFATYREMVKELVSVIKRIEGARPCFLIGQKEGLSQKEQLQRIREYELDIHNVLITTSIGEEGLSLESADLAVFYEAVPSEIRLIQRRGRVGRTKLGRIIVLISKGFRDEAYRWSAYQKEKRMVRTLHSMKTGSQETLDTAFK